jgi:peptidoglycan/LPS O-acetylase OafA/YrhL
VTTIQTAQLISLLVGTVLPLLVGLVTTRETKPGVQALLLLALAVISGFLSTLLGDLNSGVEFDVFTSTVTALTTFLVGVGMHYGLWKPTNVTYKAIDAGRTVGE